MKIGIDLKIFLGLLIAGVTFIITGAACITYAFINKNGNEQQKAHGPFGCFLILIGLFLTLADVLTANAFMAAAFGLMLSVIVFHYGITSIRKKKKPRIYKKRIRKENNKKAV